MKKALFALALTTLFASAHAASPVTEKVLAAFTAVYPGAENVKWYSHGKNYEAFFDDGTTKCRSMFDDDGKVISVLRYYGAELLSPFLKAKLAQRFPGKTIFGVTELTTDNELAYHVVLEDAKSWTHVKSDGLGQTEVTHKYRKADPK